MAKETKDRLFLGTDITRTFHIKNEDETVSINISGWTLSWMVKMHATQPDSAAILTKTSPSAIVIAGAFNSSPASNLQRATLLLTDADTESKNPGYYHWELKRMDADGETVEAYGGMEFVKGVHG